MGNHIRNQANCYFSVHISLVQALYRPYIFTVLALYRALYFYLIWLAGLMPVINVRV